MQACPDQGPGQPHGVRGSPGAQRPAHGPLRPEPAQSYRSPCPPGTIAVTGSRIQQGETEEALRRQLQLTGSHRRAGSHRLGGTAT